MAGQPILPPASRPSSRGWKAAIEVQSNALASAADAILARDPVVPVRFVPLSTPEAVLLYAEDFLPSWAGAISIDLLPAVLILILAGVHSAIRREEGAEMDAHHVTVHEMNQALRLYNAMQPPQPVQASPRPFRPRAGRRAGAR
jgi:hypothetical protein